MNGLSSHYDLVSSPPFPATTQHAAMRRKLTYLSTLRLSVSLTVT